MMSTFARTRRPTVSTAESVGPFASILSAAMASARICKATPPTVESAGDSARQERHALAVCATTPASFAGERHHSPRSSSRSACRWLVNEVLIELIRHELLRRVEQRWRRHLLLCTVFLYA